MKIKGKVYRTVVRPALMYGAESPRDMGVEESTGKEIGGGRDENAKRRTLRRKEGNGNESTGEKEDRKT